MNRRRGRKQSGRNHQQGESRVQNGQVLAKSWKKKTIVDGRLYEPIRLQDNTVPLRWTSKISARLTQRSECECTNRKKRREHRNKTLLISQTTSIWDCPKSRTGTHWAKPSWHPLVSQRSPKRGRRSRNPAWKTRKNSKFKWSIFKNKSFPGRRTLGKWQIPRTKSKLRSASKLRITKSLT